MLKSETEFTLTRMNEATRYKRYFTTMLGSNYWTSKSPCSSIELASLKDDKFHGTRTRNFFRLKLHKSVVFDTNQVFKRPLWGLSPFGLSNYIWRLIQSVCRSLLSWHFFAPARHLWSCERRMCKQRKSRINYFLIKFIMILVKYFTTLVEWKQKRKKL